MKKSLVAILAVIYLSVSTGVAFNVHYCMGKVASIDFMHSSDKCGKCGMENNNKSGCCKDEFKIVKLSDSHKIVANHINIFAPVAIIDNSKISIGPELEYSVTTSVSKNHSPPEPAGTSLNLLHCVFRI